MGKLKYKAMMSDKEIAIIESLLKPDMKCLEFGSGYSTAYFSKFVKFWHAIEDDNWWKNQVLGLIRSENIQTVMLTYAHKQKSRKATINNYLDVNIYDYDFILIDGKYREECLEKVIKEAKKGAIILLHDATRWEYREWANKYEHEVLIKGEIPEPKLKGYYKHRGIYKYEGNN